MGFPLGRRRAVLRALPVLVVLSACAAPLEAQRLGSTLPSGPPSDPSEWRAWGSSDADLDPGGWTPWPLPARFRFPLVGTPAAKGAWLAWSTQAARVRAVAATECGREPNDVQAVEACLARLRDRVGTDDGAVLALFLGVARAQRAQAGASSFDEVLSRAPAEAAGAARLARAYATAFSLGWPLAASTQVSSPFGPREHPVLGGASLHTGVDLSTPEGTPVLATGAGVVVRAGFTAVNGRFVVVDHGVGVTTAYLHNSLVLVSEGQRVTGGQVLALSGNTGRSTGPHVHYQVEFDRRPVDPEAFRPSLRAGASWASGRDPSLAARPD